MIDAEKLRIPLFDLRRAPAYGFAIENIRFVIQQVLELHEGRSLNVNISRQKSIELFLRLVYKEPQPLLDYRTSGALHRVELVGTGKGRRYEWSKEYFVDCQPQKAPYPEDTPLPKQPIMTYTEPPEKSAPPYEGGAASQYMPDASRRAKRGS